MNLKVKKILVIDGHDRRALAFVRSLGQKSKFEIHVGSSKSFNISRFSKFTTKHFKYTSPKENTELFLEELSEYITNQEVFALFPMSDEYTEIVNRNYYSLSKKVKLLMPKPEIFDIARNKIETLKFADTISVPIPKMYILSEMRNHDFKKYPVIIKPSIGTASVGVKTVRNYSELESSYQKLSDSQSLSIIQEKVLDNNNGLNVVQTNILLDYDSNVIATCVKEKIRQFPLKAGPATFFRTIHNDEAIKYASKLLKELKWIGPAEVEFIVDKSDNVPKLLEINPRLSANIVLSIKSGVDFPFLMTNIIDKSDLSNVKVDYANDNYCQWLIPGDILNFIFNKDRFKQEHNYFIRKPKPLFHMIYDKKDKAPFVFNLFYTVISLFSPRKIWRFIKR